MAPCRILHNLPDRAPRFFGFENLRREAREQLAGAWMQPVVSIEGLGAVGKTTLALELAWHVIEHPDDYPYEVIAWIGAREPALVPIGPTATPRRAEPTPHTLTRICAILGALLSEPRLARASLSGDTALQLHTLLSMLSVHAALLVIDEIEQAHAREETLLHQLLHQMPAQSRALVTARHDHTFPTPIRLIGLGEEETDAFLEQERLAFDVALDSAQRRIVRDWSVRLHYGVRVALCRIQRAGHEGALADLTRGPVGLIRPVIGRLLWSLPDAYPESYWGLRQLAAQDDIAHGITRDKARWILAQYNSQAANKILLPLLHTNLVVCVYSGRGGFLTVPPLVLWYLRQTAAFPRGGKP